MYRSEIERITGLSRKAIEYYEDKGLINPVKSENGYRIFSTDDANVLSKISLYRRLGFGINEIKQILDAKSIPRSILEIKRQSIKYQNKILSLIDKLSSGEDESLINEQLKQIEKENSIYTRLQNIFPGYFGFCIFYSYKPFFENKLDIKNEEYFEKYIEYLDKLPKLELSESEKNYIEEITGDINIETFEEINNSKIEAVYSTEDWLNKNKEALQRYFDYKKSDEYLTSDIKKIQDKIKKYFIDNKYYDIAIPLIRKFSPSYDEYYKKLLEANKNLESLVNE